MRRIVLAIMVLTMASPAMAANWVYIAKGVDGSSFYYDSESVKPYGTTIIQVWAKHIPVRTPTEKTAYVETLIYYNCAEWTSAMRSQSKFQTDASFTGAEDPYASLHMSPIRPETIDEVYLTKLCP